MIPIKTDEDLVSVIDELKHNLKAGIPYSPMKAEFNAMLNAFISKWKLDSDPHAFATMQPFEPSFVTSPKVIRFDDEAVRSGRLCSSHENEAAKPQKEITPETLKALREIIASKPPWTQEEGDEWRDCTMHPGAVALFNKDGAIKVMMPKEDFEAIKSWQAQKTAMQGTLQKIIDIDPTRAEPMTITCKNNNVGSKERLERLWAGEKEPELRKVGFWKSSRNQSMAESFFLNYGVIKRGTSEPVSNYPDVKDFIDPSWKRDHFEEYTIVVDHLRGGYVKNSYRGYSACRICGKNNGSRDITDGDWVWPEGFIHYLLEHHVKPPDEFIKHVTEMK